MLEVETMLSTRKMSGKAQKWELVKRLKRIELVSETAMSRPEFVLVSMPFHLQ